MLLLELPSEDAANINSSGIHTRRERLQDWQQAVQVWLDLEYGDRIVLPELHLDESTPHQIQQKMTK